MMDRPSLWEAHREILKAELHLANLAIAEDFLDLWKTEPCPALQRHFAKNYRKVAGVDPSHHESLTAGLQAIRQTGEGTVAEVIATLNRIHPSPLSSPAQEPHSS